MWTILLSVLLELIKGLVIWLGNYYSPAEIAARREAKSLAETKGEKKELKNAIVDDHLNNIATLISGLIRDRMRKPDEDPQRWRAGLSSTGVQVPSEDPPGNGNGSKS